MCVVVVTWDCNAVWLRSADDTGKRDHVAYAQKYGEEFITTRSAKN